MKLTKETEKVMFRDINALLSSKPIALEAGIRRLDNGMLHIAMRNVLHQCKGKMLDWWFKYFETTADLKLWHPHDHVEHGGWDSKWIKIKIILEQPYMLQNLWEIFHQYLQL